jgi:hypothetical protein
MTLKKKIEYETNLTQQLLVFHISSFEFVFFFIVQQIIISQTFMSVPKYPLLGNVHLNLANPSDGETFLTREDYHYHHYKCDGFNDVVSKS